MTEKFYDLPAGLGNSLMCKSDIGVAAVCAHLPPLIDNVERGTPDDIVKLFPERMFAVPFHR
jgi:hypothetical protein